MGSYLLLYIIVAIVSLVSSIHFFNLAHQGWMSTVLACSFEIGQMACLFGALTRRKKGFDIVWIMFVVLTLFQCMANTYAAYIGLTEYTGWSELFGLNEMEPMEQKRIIAGISGAILPLIALGFVKCLTDYLNETDSKNETIVETPKQNFEVIQPIEEKEEPITEEQIENEDFDEEEKEEVKKIVEKKQNKQKKEEPKEFDGYIMSDEDIKEMENYGRSSVSSSKKDMQETLNELKGYAKTNEQDV